MHIRKIRRRRTILLAIATVAGLIIWLIPVVWMQSIDRRVEETLDPFPR